MSRIADEKALSTAERRIYLRKRMVRDGLERLSDAEIVELILFYTIPRRDCQPIAHALIARFGTLDRMCKASSSERLSIPGITKTTDEHFVMMGMFIPFLLRNRLPAYPCLKTVEQIKSFCVALHIMHENEEGFILCLNRTRHMIKREARVIGSMPHYLHMELRTIVNAIANTATTAIILCHNHPGGTDEPSKSDVMFTRIARDYLSYLDIELVAHIVVADNTAISMRELGLLTETK